MDNVKAFQVERRASQYQSDGRKGVFIERVFDCGILGSHGNSNKEADWQWMLNVQKDGAFDPMLPSQGLAVDGDPATYWFSVGASDMTWEVDLEGMKSINSVKNSAVLAAVMTSWNWVASSALRKDRMASLTSPAVSCA